MAFGIRAGECEGVAGGPHAIAKRPKIAPNGVGFSISVGSSYVAPLTCAVLHTARATPDHDTPKMAANGTASGAAAS